MILLINNAADDFVVTSLLGLAFCSSALRVEGSRAAFLSKSTESREGYLDSNVST
jgi:hypothetical protein